jgi:hypothetical protein
LREDKQDKPGSVEDTPYRLGMFFSEVGEDGELIRGLDDEALSSITLEKGAALCTGLRRRKAQSGEMNGIEPSAS